MRLWLFRKSALQRSHEGNTRVVRSKQDEWLVLGWKLSGSNPKWWLGHTHYDLPAPDAEVVMVEPLSIAQHTAVLAMSGSGKSFFLGRFLEEVITKTRCKCVVFDPNADFRRIDSVDTEIWNKPVFKENAVPQRPLPHETDGEAYREEWGRHVKRIIQRSDSEDVDPPFERLKLRLADINGDFLAADLPSQMLGEMNYAHEFLVEVDRFLKKGKKDLLTVGERLFRLARTVTATDFVTLADSDLADASPAQIQHIYNTPRYVSETSERAYFGAIRRLIAQGMIGLQNGMANMTDANVRLRIIDLPSIPTHADQLLASHALLNAEWRRAKQEWADAIAANGVDKRVPTLLVLDEAHNLAPRDPLSPSAKNMLDQVRTIVAEGRKFGLFAVLVSQRPDKLDPIVLSECENVALMRLSNAETLENARDLLNLKIDGHVTQDLLTLGKGQVHIFGKWSSDPRGEAFLCAARRTFQGGANLRPEYWAVPEPKRDDSK